MQHKLRHLVRVATSLKWALDLQQRRLLLPNIFILLRVCSVMNINHRPGRKSANYSWASHRDRIRIYVFMFVDLYVCDSTTQMYAFNNNAIHPRQITIYFRICARWLKWFIVEAKKKRKRDSLCHIVCWPNSFPNEAGDWDCTSIRHSFKLKSASYNSNE